MDKSEGLPIVFRGSSRGSTEVSTGFDDDGILEAIRDLYSIKSCESEVT